MSWQRWRPRNSPFVFWLFLVVSCAGSTVRHVNDVHYSVCAHTMFLKHNVCSFVSLTSMAKKTRRVLTWRGWSFLHTPLAKVCTRENDKQPCIRETKYTRKKVLLGYTRWRHACLYLYLCFYYFLKIVFTFLQYGALYCVSS